MCLGLSKGSVPMYVGLLNIGLGFIEGFALILSPCILPILPIILAGSLTGSKKRPLGIICGFIVIFSLFTFFSRKLVEYSGIDLGLIRYISYGLLFLLGLIMVLPFLGEKFTQYTQRLTRVGANLASVSKPQEDFISGLIFGSLVALIWTPCAGPILAAVIVQTIIQQTTFLSFLTILAFAAGAAGPMFIIAFFGRGLLPRLGFLKTHTVLFRELLGMIIIATVVYIIYFENSTRSTTGIRTANMPTAVVELQDGLAEPYPAPALGGISAWINSQALSLNQLKGKVVLIDFWTYSCINCIRTLPYLKDWYKKYHDQGLIIIGVHTPEFDFEKDLSNVKNAVAQDGILYPVGLDNQFVTWRNFKNSYWPAHYLINKNGEVVYTHFGEGAYAETENNIRFLLGLKGPTTASSTSADLPPFAPLTPETYFGYARAERFSSPEALTKNQIAEYSFPSKLRTNSWALQGAWMVYANRIVSVTESSTLRLDFFARKVFIVMGSATNKTLSVSIALNGKLHSIIRVSKPRLYEALVLNRPEEGILQVSPLAPGLEIYTFTFGN